LIGPYFFDNRLNGKAYLSFLQNKLFELLKVDLAIRQKCGGSKMVRNLIFIVL